MQKKEIIGIYKKYFKYCKYLLFVIFLILSAYFYKKGVVSQKESTVQSEMERGELADIASTPAQENASVDSIREEKKESDGKIYVYICGSIQNPDVYALPAGSRLVTLVDMAGGFTEDADNNILNLAKVLEDGERIYVPNLTESVAYASQEAVGSAKVDINTAAKAELMTLRGIGESRAEDIIAYRESHGRFARIEDIMQVSGIKQSVFEKIKDSIEVN